MSANMAKVLPIKTKRRSTAAYAASQPLFDVLRNGMERIDLQRANLEIARDTVQKLHVKLPSASIADDVRESHEKYMDGAVKAWKLATESYAGIFEALADVTAAEPSAGREERQGHESFVRMAETARQAYEVAMDWTPTASRSAVETEVGAETGTEKDEDMQDAGKSNGEESRERNDTDGSAAMGAEDAAVPVDSKPTNAILMSLLKQRPLPEAKTEQAPTGNGAAKHTTPEPPPVTNEKNTAKAQKRLQKRQKEREKRAKAQPAKINDSEADQTIELEQRQPATNNPSEESSKLAKTVEHVSLNAEERSPDVRPAYDDVSAEVAARLKAKEAKKQASKEKKRKRESHDSLPNGETNGKAEKPQKKKARSNEGEVVEDATSKEKARKHGRDVEEGANGASVEEARKKRKKV